MTFPQPDKSPALSPSAKSARDLYETEWCQRIYRDLCGGEDMHAGVYDNPEESIADACRRTNERIINALSIPAPHSRVLDLGAGFGGLSRTVAKRLPVLVDAVDHCPTTVERHRQLCRTSGLSSRVRTHEASFDAIPAADQTYAAVLAIDTWMHSDDRKRAMSEATRVMRQGGELILSDPLIDPSTPREEARGLLRRYKLSSLPTSLEYETAAEANGLEILEFIDLSLSMVQHDVRLLDELETRQDDLIESEGLLEIDRLKGDLARWISAGKNRYLTWGLWILRKS